MRTGAKAEKIVRMAYAETKASNGAKCCNNGCLAGKSLSRKIWETSNDYHVIEYQKYSSLCKGRIRMGLIQC